jgi:NTE family protein
MYDAPLRLHRTHRDLARPDFEQIALVLQGGGALGAYQAGVYQALDEAGVGLDWVAGVSIGAINAALIAGSPPRKRLDNLRQFWDEVSTDPLCTAWQQMLPRAMTEAEDVRVFLNHISAATAMIAGVKSMYAPRMPPAWMSFRGAPEATSFFDPKPLRDALERIVDFDRINAGTMRFSVGAVNIQSGNFVYFDAAANKIRPEHILASAALPPTFPPVEIDGEVYWDGGLVSNTPLQWVVESEPHRDTLVFQVDLWSTRGQRPTDLAEVATRQKEIQYASRTRASTNAFRRLQRLRHSVAELLAELPEEIRQLPSAHRLADETDRKVFRIVHLIYHAQPHQGSTKDFEFSKLNVGEHWETGYHDAVRTLRHPEALARPDLAVTEGVATFDVAVDGRL